MCYRSTNYNHVRAHVLSHVALFVTPWTVSRQAPLSMAFSRQEYWRIVACLSPGDLPDPGIEPMSHMSPALAGRFFTTSATFYLGKVKESEVTQSCPTLCNPMETRLLCPWDFLGKNTGVGCHFLLQGIFPTQGSKPGLPPCRQTLYHLSHQGSPRFIL